MKTAIAASAFLTLASAASILPRQSTVACNNSPDLCSKSYSEIIHLGAHDSPFVRDATTDDSISGNQYYNSTVQLNAGVRLLSAQVHRSNSQWHLCHSSCDLLDAGTLTEWLIEIKHWLANNTNDVVTVLLVNSDNASPAELASQYEAANITNYAYTPPSTTVPPTTWPTLQELISADTRLLNFVASLNASDISSNNSYLMDEFTFIFETPYDNSAYSNFTCTPDRPSAVKGNLAAGLSSNRMPFVNHFLYSVDSFDIETPNTNNITFTNSPSTSPLGTLGQSLTSCQSAYKKNPVFTLVDFFDQGPSIQAVDQLNGVTNPTGRISVPPRDASTDTAAGSFAGIMSLTKQVSMGQKPSTGAWIWGSGRWSWGGLNLNGGSIVE